MMTPRFSSCGQSLSQLLSYVVISILLFTAQTPLVFAHPGHGRRDIHARHQAVPARGANTVDNALIYRNAEASPFDLVKSFVDANAPVNILHARQVTDDDYSCSETKPCSNGACCSKSTGYCNYGPKACGTNGQSPNEVCWSNCDAHAECGKYAAEPGAKCPLNVCCSQFGFCGMTEEFCTKSKDKDTGCQSNCDQPGSGASGGDVQSRVIGYYEAWAHGRSCSGMASVYSVWLAPKADDVQDFKDIPVGGLTHLYFSFAYISPGGFNVVPMDDLPVSLFSDLTNLKKKNSALKTVVALGGWTFNDNGTATQPVYSTMVSSKSNRATFIVNLLSFLREFAFDGVDFDWEYPGAGDRGGTKSDGFNFTQFLKELRDAIDKEPIQYSVSFTIPTSYWYLRHFDLKAVDHVDFVNVMSYDLHGVWDSTNPIGSHVYAHTNLTEIKLAMDLLWRNDVEPQKLNLGIGFYGRSFQLSDPSCYQPGCNFKGGAAPGVCTKNSGTLSYREITEIIKEKNLTPYHDKKDAVKYLLWNNDQWVSYDDKDTFAAKIKLANGLGLGGLLIWSVDQDTPDLKALQAVLAPKDIRAFAKNADGAAYWQDVAAQDCYVSDCGKGCDKPGFIKITNQPCGSATPVFRHSSEDDSSLCCPLAAAPDSNECRWRGSAPSCNGHCEDGEVVVELNKWGDGKYCEDGNKAYCCNIPEGKENNCYWTGAGGRCKSGDELLTFKGTFLETIADIAGTFGLLVGQALSSALDGIDMELYAGYCCPADEAKRWKNCAWHGKPGSCFDNHCDLGHQVQLTQSDYGLGESCAPRLERTRVFCCDPSDGESPFLPVPLDYLFPHPPTGDDVDTDFDIKVDNTWGDGHADTSDEDPNSSTFGFVVMTSPEELQTSLDKRDGSHWELFNCNNPTDEGEQTVQMICTDLTENSNCGKISLGHGVPGTILEMPKGCSNGRYVVAKDMVISSNQVLPSQIAKRSFGHKSVVYDLTFDYEWMRVPRDLGNTQVRVDYSNEVGYWDNIVDKAAGAKRKRSLADAGGSHKRWLEEEWRQDAHFSGIDRRDLHARWFGSDVIDWLKGLLNGGIKPEFTHNIDQSFVAILLQEKWDCKVNGVDLSATLDARATAKVQVATSFGLTLITTLKLPLDLSQSYLYFKNKGDVSAVFTLDAVGKAVFSSGDFKIAGLDNFPGATFSIPSLVTVGPNFILNAAVDAEVTLAGHLESRVDIASWDIQQTYPDHSSDWDPKALDEPSRDGTGLQGVKQPTFDYSVTATGHITAHLKPTFEFGIAFDKMWNVGDAKVDIVADGWVRLTAAAGISSSGNCPFTYGLDVGADLYARAEAPSTFGWSPKSFPIAAVPAKTLKEGGSCPLSERRSIGYLEPGEMSHYAGIGYVEAGNASHHLVKRGPTVGPAFSLQGTNLFCPNPQDSASGKKCSEIQGWNPGQNDDSALNSLKRSLLERSEMYALEKRAGKDQKFCEGSDVMSVTSPNFDSSGDLVSRFPNVATYGPMNPDDCNDFEFGKVNTPQGAATAKFATEHILEYQLYTIFLDAMKDKFGQNYRKNPLKTGTNSVDMCKYMKPYWQPGGRLWFILDGGTERKNPLNWVGSVFPGKNNAYESEFVLLPQDINGPKARMWGNNVINNDDVMVGYLQQDPDKAIKNVKDVLMAYKYHQQSDIATYWQNQVRRVGDMLDRMDQLIPQKQDPSYETYKSMNLKSEWNTWISGRIYYARHKAEQYMNHWVDKLKDGYIPADTSKITDQTVLTRIEKIRKLDDATKALAGTSWAL